MFNHQTFILRENSITLSYNAILVFILINHAALVSTVIENLEISFNLFSMPENYIKNQTISTVNLSTRSPFDAHVLNTFHKLVHKLMWITSELILRSSSIVSNNLKQVKMLVYIIPLKQPNGIRGRPAFFETHSCPDAWVTINKVSKMRMNLRDQIAFPIRKPLFGNGGFIRLDAFIRLD